MQSNPYNTCGILRINLVILFLLLSGAGFTQTNLHQGQFRSPVDFPISLSGSFAEIRANHFHSGIDIRTGGVTGKPIYAVTDGSVSRIYVSPYGFGKAIYINHPSGHTSVYAHLDRFNKEITTYVRAKQYAKESFAIDEYIDGGKIQVRKGDVIGYSGNSGSSGGPHLHFELRELASQDPLDPFSFGIPVTDHQDPQIRWIKIYPADARGMVDYVHQPKAFQVTGSNGMYSLQTSDTIRVSGNIYFGIEAYDYHETSSIRCGIKQIELYVDNERVFGQRIDQFSFADTRYVNAILDYADNQRSKRRVQRSYIAPGNTLDIFYGVNNRGILSFTDDNIHQVKYTVKDSRGNESQLVFRIKSHQPPQGRGQSVEPEWSGTLFRWNQSNQYSTPDVVFDLPSGALYEDFRFVSSSRPGGPGLYSPIHAIHKDDVPMHVSGELKIRAVNLPRRLQGKAVVVRIDEKGQRQSKSGTWEDGFVKTKIREFGNYAISVDTISPVIKPVNVFNGKKLTSQKTIAVKLSDDLSGIAKYRGTLNGEWILMDYDGKTGQLVYAFDTRIKNGENLFRLVVTDGVGNQTICEYKLFHVGL